MFRAAIWYTFNLFYHSNVLSGQNWCPPLHRQQYRSRHCLRKVLSCFLHLHYGCRWFGYYQGHARGSAVNLVRRDRLFLYAYMEDSISKWLIVLYLRVNIWTNWTANIWIIIWKYKVCTFIKIAVWYGDISDQYTYIVSASNVTRTQFGWGYDFHI